MLTVIDWLRCCIQIQNHFSTHEQSDVARHEKIASGLLVDSIMTVSFLRRKRVAIIGPTSASSLGC